MERIHLADLEIGYTDALKALAEMANGIRMTKNSTADLEAEQKKLREEGRAGTDQYDKNAKAIEQNKVVLSGLNTEYRNAQNIVTSNIAANTEQLGTIQKLDARNKELRASLRGLNLETEEGKKTQKAYIQEINKNTDFIKANSDAAIQQKMNIGNYKSALDLLPASLQSGARGFQTIGNAAKLFLANPIVLVITAIVGALALLAKAFKGTDEGALKMDMAMKAIGNIVDVLFDRITSFTKLLKDLFTFNWKELKKDGEETFGGIGSSIKDAVEAGINFARTMDEIEEGMAASAVTRAKMRNDMEMQKQLMRDVTKSYAERQAAAQKAFDLEKKINEQDVEWKEKSTEAEIVNLAAKLQNYDMTLEQKTKQVKEWLNLDAEQLKSGQETNSELADFYNKNEEAFQKAQKALSEDIDTQTEFYLNTKRLTTSLSSFNKELLDEDRKKFEVQDENLQKQNEAYAAYLDSVVKSAEEEMLKEVEIEKQKIAEKERLRQEAAAAEQQWDEDMAAFRRERNFTIAENERLAKEASIQDQFLLQEQALNYEKETEINAAIAKGDDIRSIEKKYAAYSVALEKEKQKAKLAVMGDFAGALAGLFDEETVLGKAAAITQTVINTYLGAMSAFAQTPGGIGIKLAAAGTAILTGAKALKNILKTGKGGGGSSASVSDVSGTTSTATESTVSPSSMMVNAVSSTQTVLVIEDYQRVANNQVAVRTAAEL